MRPLIALLSICALLADGAAAAETVPDHPDARLAANVAGVVSAIDEGDLGSFVRERDGAEMLRGTSNAESAAFLCGLREARGRLELCRYRQGLPSLGEVRQNEEVIQKTRGWSGRPGRSLGGVSHSASSYL